MGSIPGSGTSHGGGPGNPLHCSCLGNPMDRGAWWATAHGVAKSWTQLSDFHFFHLKSNTCLLQNKLEVHVSQEMNTHFPHHLSMWRDHC